MLVIYKIETDGLNTYFKVAAANVIDSAAAIDMAKEYSKSIPVIVGSTMVLEDTTRIVYGRYQNGESIPI